MGEWEKWWTSEKKHYLKMLRYFSDDQNKKNLQMNKGIQKTFQEREEKIFHLFS